MTDTQTPQSSANAPKLPLTSIDQINSIIKRKDVAYASNCFIPSIKKEVPFNEINTAQQKRLVKSVIDSPVYNTEFIRTFRDILVENCQDKSINIDDLNIIDKLILALNLRIKSIGSNLDVEIDTKTGNKVSVSMDLSKILDLAYSNLNDVDPVTIEDAYYKIECSIPSIGTEFAMEKELRSNVNNIEINDLKELRKTVGDAFVGEITKYISKVSIKDETDEIPVDWQRFTYTNRIKVIETFKTGLLMNIIDFINKVREQADKIELVKFEFNGEIYERRLTIDGNFFTIS